MIFYNRLYYFINEQSVQPFIQNLVHLKSTLHERMSLIDILVNEVKVWGQLEWYWNALPHVASCDHETSIIPKTSIWNFDRMAIALNFSFQAPLGAVLAMEGQFQFQFPSRFPCFSHLIFCRFLFEIKSERNRSTRGLVFETFKKASPRYCVFCRAVLSLKTRTQRTLRLVKSQ